MNNRPNSTLPVFKARYIARLMSRHPDDYDDFFRPLLERSAPYGILTYGPVYKALWQLHRGRGVSEVSSRLLGGTHGRVRAFREKALPKIEWYSTEVLPRISRIRRRLEGDGRKGSPDFVVAGTPITGGPHAIVEWEDGSLRVLYVLGPQWSLVDRDNLYAVLQEYTITVLGMYPSCVVLVDMPRRQLITERPPSTVHRSRIETVVRQLHVWLRDRAS